MLFVYSGGAEMLFSNKKIHEINLPDSNKCNQILLLP